MTSTEITANKESNMDAWFENLLMIRLIEN